MAASIKAGLNNDMHLMTDGVTRAYIDSDGNMGIGTTNPDTNSKLHVATGAGTFVARDENGYTRATANNGSAQLGLFRAGAVAGGMYIGADADAFRLYNSSFAQRMNVTQDGYMTTPNQPFAFVDFGGPATYAGMSGIAPFDNIVQSQGNHYSTSTYRFTCPVTGIYQISSGFLSQYSSDQYHVAYQKNGTRISRNYTTYRANQTSMLLKCASGDYLDINLEESLNYYQGTGSDRYCWATYMLVG